MAGRFIERYDYEHNKFGGSSCLKEKIIIGRRRSLSTTYHTYVIKNLRHKGLQFLKGVLFLELHFAPAPAALLASTLPKKSI